MSEETAAATPAAEHVSIGDNGAFVLSPEALDAMDNVTPHVEDVPTEEATPAAEVETPAEVQLQGRKIKHNGQEVEVKPEQEVELLQKGYNYEQKMAQLEAERARLQSYNGLVQAIETSPAIKQKVAEALGYQQPQVQTEVPQFDDPIEQLKWETRQEVMREVEEKFVKPMQQQSQMSAHQQNLATVRQQVQADPQFKEIQAEIINQIKALPESVGKNLYLQLDQDPKSYIEMFQTVKARLGSNKQPTESQSVTPEPTRRETKAPLLEAGDNSPQPSATEQQKQAERIKDLTRRSKQGDFRATGELMSLMA